ncbi:MAG: IS6 family transposase [Sphingobacteriaceae bacterium]|nr:MAG: IS6 family transposase [Sphingobacteriaceae bacterium]
MSERYKGYRTYKSIIGYTVRHYYRYKLSLRDLSELLMERGIDVTYETIRKWCKTWGPIYAQAIRKKRGSNFKDKWHIDEMRVKIKGEVYWLWRLIDGDGEEIEVLLQRRRNAKAAVRFLKKALKIIGAVPRIMITDKLRSYKKAHRVLLKSSEHRSHKRLNNLIENAHQPTREKERQMRGFKLPGSAQRFIATMGTMLNLLKVGRYKHTASIYKEKFKNAINIFNNIVDSHHYYV